MKRLATITAFLIIFSGFAAASPNVEVQKMSTEPNPLKVGQYADVRFKVTNTGTEEEAENVSIEFAENYPFSVDPDNTKSWRIASLEEGDTYQFRLQTRVDPNALQGQEELKFISEIDENSRTHLMNVDLKADDDGLTIKDVEFPDKVVSGTTRTMNMTLENTANAYFRNIE
ncbi:MAG: hypothetical protein BRC30_03685, partial [Nanohaloarchaea archaeon SW_7_46_7]